MSEGYDDENGAVCDGCGRPREPQWLGAPSRSDAATYKRAWAPDGPRERRVQARFTDGELAELRAFAEHLGTTPGVWVAQVSLSYARGLLRPIPENWRDVLGQLIRARADMTKAGIVLNQVARHANATGDFGDEAEEMLADAKRILTRLDQFTAEASDRISHAR